ncbi:DUF6262 family protein [Saccharopolyspora sp. ASAGF58]|uniref:DUF6262 family protein n=1 Tax=Saccharopolyspora sp. ASAGF58 TaxID=2719023 RepID=UPI0035303973
MVEGRRADSGRRRQRVLTALHTAVANGDQITVSAIARASGVDRSFLYRHRDLLEQLHAADAQPPNTADPAVRAPRRASLARVRARRPRRHRPAQPADRPLRTAGHRSAPPARGTRPGPHRRPRRQPRADGPHQRPKHQQLKTPTSHLRHTCCTDNFHRISL